MTVHIVFTLAKDTAGLATAGIGVLAICVALYCGTWAMVATYQARKGDR